MLVLEIAFWASVGLLVYTHVGYPLLLALLRALRGRRAAEPAELAELPAVTLAVAAHNEEGSIAGWVANALALDYPRELLQIVVACDGCTDATAARAREAGADHVVELERGGKVAALNAVASSSGSEVLGLADANSRWEPDALRRLVARLTGGVGYVCGNVSFTAPDGTTNQEGLYWRYEMAVRRMESDLAGITGGNGAINAVRSDAYIALSPGRGQDISFPFELAKHGIRAEYEPRARATEPMAPTIEGEFRRKRRMMSGAWNTILNTGLLSPRGYSPLYALEIYSHRLLRYTTPILHLVALGTNIALVGEGSVYVATLIAQGALLASAVAGRFIPVAPLLVARYYAAVTAASAVGLWDLLRHGVPKTWESVEGTR